MDKRQAMAMLCLISDLAFLIQQPDPEKVEAVPSGNGAAGKPVLAEEPVG